MLDFIPSVLVNIFTVEGCNCRHTYIAHTLPSLTNAFLEYYSNLTVKCLFICQILVPVVILHLWNIECMMTTNNKVRAVLEHPFEE